MDDLEWLAFKTGCFAVGGWPLPTAPRHAAGVVVEPTRVREAARLGVPVAAVVGWPDGRHHSVIKAAEARLAVESGADEVWFCVDADAAGDNEVLADIIAVRQAVAAPARLSLVCSGRGEVARAGALAGADRLVCAAGEPLPGTQLDVVVYGVADTAEAVVDALDAGAVAVFTELPRAG